MNQNPLQPNRCKRWYCKNTISAYAALHTGGYCEHCDKGRKTLGWFFPVQPFIRVLSFPFLFIGGCGLGLQIAEFLSSGPEKEAFYENPLPWFIAVALTGGLFGFG